MRKALFVGLLWAVSAAVAAGPSEWKPLFDGKTTAGWTGMRGATFPTQTFAVEDGSLRTLEDGSGGDIRTVDEYTNFELEFEWKISPGGNAGLKYNVQEAWTTAGFKPNLPPERKAALERSAVGFEYQVIDDSILKRKPGWEKSATGALYLIYAAEGQKKMNPPLEWNKARIVVDGNHVEHWLNGEKLFECELGSKETLERVEQTKFRRMPGYGLAGTGPIVLQHHGHPAWFRNLRIRELP